MMRRCFLIRQSSDQWCALAKNNSHALIQSILCDTIAAVMFRHGVDGAQVLSAVLLWNYGLTGQLDRLRGKVERDFVPTLVNGVHSAGS